MASNQSIKDFTGKTFGRLTVLGFDSWNVQPSGQRKTQWLCSCECGKTKVVQGCNLSGGTVQSCGCLHKERTSAAKTTHGMTETRTYKTWRSMLERCLDTNSKTYPIYGGVGITVCDRWVVPRGGSFENFLEDMGERPKGKTLNRIKGVNHYSKETCEWATFSEQCFDQKKRSSNTSGRTGVYWIPKDELWIAKIYHQNKQIFLLSTKDYDLACKAREAAEIKYFGYSKANR